MTGRGKSAKTLEQIGGLPRNTLRNPTGVGSLAVQRSYRRNYWTHQPQQVEVWSEKGTVRGTLAPVLDKYGGAV